MDEFAAETKVEWREWGCRAFEAAATANKPVLLALTVPWSLECSEMDRRTYDEPRIAAHVNDGFVPVRVDADRHPRVRERYNMGGFPSTVFLTTTGSVLSGATFLGPDGFRGILDSVRETWDADGDAAGSVPRSVRAGTPPAGDVTPHIEEHMVEQLLASYDETSGGWGKDTKFPMPRTVEFALVRARDQATRTLDAIRTHLRDTSDGGFYRYATNRDWSGAREEKLLDENAAILRAFAHGYRYTGEAAYRETAEDTVEYLATTLFREVESDVGDTRTERTDPNPSAGAFAASQAGKSLSRNLASSDRERTDVPPVDQTIFADRNGIAIDALCTFAAYTDDERAIRYAECARDYIVETLVDDEGVVAHYRADNERCETGLLLDQARVLQGLTTSWQVLGDGGPATSVADWTIEHLRDDLGAFRDARPAGAGLLSRPQYPLDSTVALANALVDLSALTGDHSYHEVAREAVAAYAGATDRIGVQVAEFASVASRLIDCTTVAVGTPAGSDLHRAALRLTDHESVVVPDASGLDEAAERRADGEATTTATSPGELEALLTD